MREPGAGSATRQAHGNHRILGTPAALADIWSPDQGGSKRRKQKKSAAERSRQPVIVVVFPRGGPGTARMMQLGKLKAVLALLYEIAELERVCPPDREAIDRLKVRLQVILTDEDQDCGGGPSHEPPDLTPQR